MFGSIRASRTDDQKAQIVTEMRRSIQTHTGIALDDIGGMTADVPVSWVLEGAAIMPLLYFEVVMVLVAAVLYLRSPRTG